MDREQRLDEVITAYLQAVEAGRPPNETAWLAQYPDLADDLRAFLASQRSVERVAAPLRPSARNLADQPTVAPGEATTNATLGTVRYFGDYELLEEIARGGMGVVYKARQRSLDRVVALKMILAGQLASEADVQRFRHEAQLAARLQHPGIVALHEVGEHEGQHFFSMDYIEGQSLADLVREHPLPAPQAIRYVRLIAEAVHFAHEHGVLHRDLKPSNALIDCFDQPRVTDFGLAKNIQKDAGLTDTGAVLGTPSYMPPEQASGARGRVGPHSDVYALGAVLYELVTGRPPFQAATALDTLLQVLGAEPVSPRLLNPALSRNLETVILKCLHKDPTKRYASARELADDLDALLESRPIKARRPSLPERLGLWIKQQSRTFRVVATTMVTAALVLLGVWSFLELLRIIGLGRISFETDGEIQLVELFAEEANPVPSPFAAPTREPLRLPRGAYQARVSAPYRLSETVPLLVKDSLQMNVTRVDLSKRLLGEPVPCTGWFEFVPRGAGHDLLTVVSLDTLRRYEGATGELQWTVTLGLDGRRVEPGQARNRPPAGDMQGGFFRPWLSSRPLIEAERFPHLVRPWYDLDGDGEPDLVLANATGCELVALSGKTGKSLWLFRPTPPGQDPGGLPKGSVQRVGRAVSFPCAGQGDRPMVLALFEGSIQGANSPVWWAEGIDARTGTSLWRHRSERPWSAYGPWVEAVDGRQILVCVTGSRLVGLEVQSGKPAWQPIDLGFTPPYMGFTPTDRPASPAWASLGGDRGLAVVLRDSNTRTVRAITVPTGKVLWTCTLPPTPAARNIFLGPTPVNSPEREMGWSGPGPGFLTDPLSVDLDGDGKAEVIVPDDRGTIAVLDGSSGQVRWRSSVAINQGRPSAACVLVGPDLDGDGCQDLFVANVVNERPEDGLLAFFAPAEYGHYLRFQALSGKTGAPVWRSRFRNVGWVNNRELGTGMPLIAWQKGRDGWPLLVVPGERHTLVVEAATGQLAHVIQSLRGPYRSVDLDGDGVPDLIGFQYSPEDYGWRGRLHCFRGTATEAVASGPVTPREETVEWIPYPLQGILLFDPNFPANLATAMLPVCLVFLGYTGFRLLRRGWGGLWFPVLAYLVLVLGLAVIFLVSRPALEPWQRCSWAVFWYWIFFAGLFLAGFLTLGWLGIIGVVRLVGLVFGRVRAEKAALPS